jgi:hypothetical protein
MADHLISMFIDDELSLDEKLVFLEAVRDEPEQWKTAVELIRQEKWLRSEVVRRAPSPAMPPTRTRRFSVRLCFGLTAVGALIVMLLVVLGGPRPAVKLELHRFVLYQPGAERVELSGSFTDWQRVPMKPVGTSGYWELTLELPAGEHRFAYILDDKKIMTDPTVLTREKDDFGGENSVLTVGV